jgi:hypothetical protein
MSGFIAMDVSYYPEFTYLNFADTTGLTLVSTASITSNNIYLINTSTNQSGNVYRSDAIKFDRSFGASFQFECSGGTGADGFCLQWTVTNNSTGSAGGGLSRINNANTIHALSFTTYSAATPGITWWKNNVQQGTKQSNAISWRQNVYYWVDYLHEAQTCSVYYSTTNSKPASPNHTFTSFVFDSGTYYMGFGAASGTNTDNHILKAVSLNIRR